MLQPRYFILDDQHQLQAVDMLTWACWLEEERGKRIVKQETVGRFWISTVFLGLGLDDLGLGYHPQFFETMAFRGPEQERMPDLIARVDSWEEAEAAHAHAVKLFTRYERMLSLQDAILQQMENQL